MISLLIREYLLAYCWFAVGLAGVLLGVLRDDMAGLALSRGLEVSCLIDGASWLNCSSLLSSGTVHSDYEQFCCILIHALQLDQEEQYCTSLRKCSRWIALDDVVHAYNVSIMALYHSLSFRVLKVDVVKYESMYTDHLPRPP